MPTKKGFPTVAEKVAQELSANFDQKLEKIQSDVADKFSRLEQAMLRMVAPTQQADQDLQAHAAGQRSRARSPSPVD